MGNKLEEESYCFCSFFFPCFLFSTFYESLRVNAFLLPIIMNFFSSFLRNLGVIDAFRSVLTHSKSALNVIQTIHKVKAQIQ